MVKAGPVVNTIGEQPYLALNDRLNSTQAHGRNVYMSAATQWKKPHTVATPVLSKFKSLIELDAEKFATSYVAFEYIPSSSFAKKPSDSTAFNCRGYHSNCLTAIQWKGEKKDMTEFPQAKKWAKEISSILDTGEGNHETPYGNYGQWALCAEGPFCQADLGLQREIRWSGTKR